MNEIKKYRKASTRSLHQAKFVDVDQTAMNINNGHNNSIKYETNLSEDELAELAGAKKTNKPIIINKKESAQMEETKETGNISVSINTQQELKKIADVPALCERAEIVIQNQDDYNKAADVLKDVKARYKELDTQRKDITKPLDTAKKNVMELFRLPLELLEKAENFLKKGMIGYSDEQDRKAKEEQARLQKLADAEAAKQKKILDEKIARAEASGKTEKVEELEYQKETIAPIVVPVVSANIDTPTGVSYRDKWSAVVTDEKLVPREYLIVNQQALDKVAQATKGTIQIPGVKFEMAKILASR